MILSSAGMSFYLDGECSGYNHNAWMCTYWGPSGTLKPVDLISPHYTSAQSALVLGAEVSMWCVQMPPPHLDLDLPLQQSYIVL